MLKNNGHSGVSDVIPLSDCIRKYLKICILPCLIFAYGCVSIKPENIQYNTSKRLFEYHHGNNAVTLRNKNNQLVDSSNIDYFQIELQHLKRHYPFNQRMENDVLLKKSGYKVAQLYSEINAAIQDKNYTQSLRDIVILRRIYPDIDYYSDCSFLEGYTCEKLGQSDHAAAAYQKFYSYSGQKYSMLFRGYRYADKKDSMYIAERNHAYHLLNQRADSLNEDIIQPIQAKYYHSSDQPGFISNPEDYSKQTKQVCMFSLGRDISGDFSFGCQLSFLFDKTANLNIMAYNSRNTSGFGLSAPIQLYKSRTENLGIKLSPFVCFNMIDSIKIDGQYLPVDYNVINFGAKISTACFINQKFYIGTYYLYNYFNENNPYFTKKAPVRLWYNNEYDISGYYAVFKNLSLKAGVKNSDIVAGVYLGGLEISYNFTSPGIILRTDLF